MYNKLLDLIEEEKNLEVVKQLNIIKHRIDRGEPEGASIREVYEYLCDEASASLDKKYLKTVKASVEALEKIINHEDDEEVNEEVKDAKDVVVNLPNEEEVEEAKEEKNEVKEEKVKKVEEHEEHECKCGTDCKCGPKCDCHHEVGVYNKTAVALRTCVFIEGLIGYVLGVFMGFSKTNNAEYFSLAIMISYWLVTGVMILLTLGLAEVIQILHDIRKNIENE